MANTYFVTGTDTDAGKTVVSCGLLEAARQKQLQTIALKPISAGCESTPEGLRNGDAVKLMEAMTIKLPYAQVNPVAFEPPIAPHIAAEEEGRRITVDRLSGICRGALMRQHDLSLIEGAGGWRVPLNNREMLSELAVEMNTPVILVVGMKLGCLSHALLSVESILRDGLTLAGWVANRIDPDMNHFEENVQTLKDSIPAPCLGVIPWLDSLDNGSVAGHLDIQPLLK
ncbi:dethiobiotin synthase [Endozoicomonas montiporae]|uniref:ATP-dependent dethiobiotin synthetase BioD n=2 Tax=Endozoicomonas montiporae TaxID=1027273 RepID=A0A081N2J1_9GAMM|nr:dethiobiotin synthase [Endozoicomonas montiporae]AMO54785.1 dithiobiotin synthetase [Endozoicomonas montiporae CL-33]KEQ12664.1 dethiobiotin synthase [Endozoicomonas montiporae]